MHVSREQNEAHRRSRNVPAFYITTWCLHTWHSYMPSSWTVTARICSNQSVLEWITTNRLSTEWVLLPTVNNRLFFRFIHVIWNWKKVQLKENGRPYLSINFTRIFMSLCVCVCVRVYYYYRRMTLLFSFFFLLSNASFKIERTSVLTKRRSTESCGFELGRKSSQAAPGHVVFQC